MHRNPQIAVETVGEKAKVHGHLPTAGGVLLLARLHLESDEVALACRMWTKPWMTPLVPFGAQASHADSSQVQLLVAESSVGWHVNADVHNPLA